VISTSEFKEAMNSIGLSPTDSELKNMVDSVNSDGKGKLNLAEFESLVTREVTQSSLSFARKYFEMYDTDKDGVITVDELYKSLHAAGFSDEHIEDATKELLESADFDKDKKVSFEGKQL
jgi:Ca2+-binding EF-hand superfamily protein